MLMRGQQLLPSPAASKGWCWGEGSGGRLGCPSRTSAGSSGNKAPPPHRHRGRVKASWGHRGAQRPEPPELFAFLQSWNFSAVSPHNVLPSEAHSAQKTHTHLAGFRGPDVAEQDVLGTSRDLAGAMKAAGLPPSRKHHASRGTWIWRAEPSGRTPQSPSKCRWGTTKALLGPNNTQA